MSAKPQKYVLGPLLAVVLALPTSLKAQSEPPTPTPTPDPFAGIQVQVFDQQQVEIGAHKITFNRIAPPAFPAPTPTPPPQEVPVANTNNRSALTRKSAVTAQASVDEAELKPFKTIFLSATVYDHQFTELRWSNGVAPILRVYVNIDFDYFSGFSRMETADAVYELFFGLGNDTSDSLVQNGRQLPNLAAFPSGYPSYQIIEGNATDHASDIADLDALCAYYEANKARLIADYQQRQADQAAREQWLRDHPPVQPDTVINYWPVQGSVYLKP